MIAGDKAFNFLATQSYYDIPFFQRAYVWGEENWSELFYNLTGNNQNHFLGSLILKKENFSAGDIARFNVIDGQQRLTTLSVLLRAIYDHISHNREKYGYSDEAIDRCRLEMEQLLFVSDGGIERTLKVKICHSLLDKNAYESVINGELDKEDRWEKIRDSAEADSENAIVLAYVYFRDELIDCLQTDINKLWQLLTQDKVRFLVNIDLGENDNEQAIFDTVNSAGVRLSSSDTIKNLLFQRYIEVLRMEGSGSPLDIAVDEYNKTWTDAFLRDKEMDAYWNEEKRYGRMKRTNIENFLHSFAVVEGFFNPADDSMADLSQKYRDKSCNMGRGEMENFLKRLHDYAGLFKEYFEEEPDNLRFNDYIHRLFNICNALEISTFHPYLLQQIYAYRIAGSLTEDELNNRFRSVERYLVLTAICNGSTKNYNNECKQLVDGKISPEEIMNSSLYISEEAFRSGLRRMTLNKVPTILLFWIELSKRIADYTDIKGLSYNFTLEHIMPQKWSQNWKDVPIYDSDDIIIEDNDEIERIRNNAVYEIGNMTLLNSKLNSSISNGTFKDKINGKNGKKGIKDLADLMITKEIIKEDEWNEKKIYARTEELEGIIRKIWDAEELPKEIVSKKSLASAGRHELRISFWKKAIPIIVEINEYESFTNVNPTISNTIAGSFGISGFSVQCSANYDKARVDFCLSKRDAEVNKDAYDILFSHKDEIEEKLGIKLIWDRANSYKSSFISYYMNGVSIANEDDWGKMSSFMGEWSCKLRRVILPYLTEKFPPDETGNRKSPEEIKRLEEISRILLSWAVQRSDIEAHPEKSNRTCTRFVTKTMSEILPDIKDAPSGWKTDNHYFYEIVNRNALNIYFQMTINSKNITDDFRKRCDELNEVSVRKYSKDEWQWWKIYRSERIELPEELDKGEIFRSLDKAIEDVFSFEKDIKMRLEARNQVV